MEKEPHHSARFRKTNGYLLAIAFFALTTVVVCFFGEGIAFFNPVYTSKMNDIEFFISFAASVLLSAGCILLARRFFGLGISWKFAATLVFLFVGNILATFLFPEVTEGYRASLSYPGQDPHYIYVLTLMAKWRFVLCSLVEFAYLYILFVIAPHIFGSVIRIAIVPFAIIAVCVVAIVFSLFAEWPIYEQILTGTADFSSLGLLSFTNHKNTYGFLLMMGIFACGYMDWVFHQWPYRIVGGVLFIFLLPSVSLTSIALSVLFIFAYIGAHLLKQRKEKPALVWSILGAALCLAVAFIVLLFTRTLSSLPGIGVLFDKLLSAFVSFDGSTLDSRWMFVQHSFLLLDTPLKIIFGLGDSNYFWALGAYEGGQYQDAMAWPHNAYVGQLGFGGIVRLAAYFGLLAYLIYRLVVAHKKKSPVFLPCLLMFACFLIYGFFETTSYLEISTKSVAFFLLSMLPVFIETRSSKEIGEPDQPARIGQAANRVFYAKVGLITLSSLIISSVAITTAGSGFPDGTFFVCIAFVIAMAVTIAALHDAPSRLIKWSLIADGLACLLVALSFALPYLGMHIASISYLAIYAAASSIFLVRRKPNKEKTGSSAFLNAGFIAIVLLVTLLPAYCIHCLVPASEKTPYTIVAGIFLSICALAFVLTAVPQAEVIYACSPLKRVCEKEEAIVDKLSMRYLPAENPVSDKAQ